MASIFNFDHCDIKSSQVGENNSIVVRNFVSEDDWEELELFFNRKKQTLDRNNICYFLAKEAEDYTKKRNKIGLKNFIQKYASEFATGIFCNIASTNIINLLEKLGIQI